MKRAALLLVLLCQFSRAQNITCFGEGLLRLTAKSNTIECKELGNDVILWGVTYDKVTKKFRLYSRQMNSDFGVPAQPLQRYLGSAVRGTHDAWYTMTSGPFEDDHQVLIVVVGHE